MNLQERRKHERRSLIGETVVMTYPHLVVSGTLVDLSPGGLAFLYSSANPLPPRDFSLHIIREDFSISDVPVSIISDQPSTAKIFERRCGVSFAPMPSRLRRKIDSLLASGG